MKMQKLLRTLYFVTLSFLLLSCTAKKPATQGDALLNIVNADHLSLAVYNHDSLSTYHQRGVNDLLELLENEPQRLQGAIVADKIVGKASAALLTIAGVQEVYTNIITTQAREILESAGITVSAKEEVPMILNRDQTGQCPMDKSLNDIDNLDSCINILKNRQMP